MRSHVEVNEFLLVSLEFEMTMLTIIILRRGLCFYQENRKQSFLGFRCICDTPKGPVGIGIELSPSPLLFSSAYVTGFPIFFHAKWDSVFIG